MRKMEEKYFKNPEKHIPKGHYCYDDKGVCPFWDKDESKPYQENGYCHFFKEGDWMNDRFGLLWDQVKECGIKDEIDEEELNSFNKKFK